MIEYRKRRKIEEREKRMGKKRAMEKRARERGEKNAYSFYTLNPHGS